MSEFEKKKQLYANAVENVIELSNRLDEAKAAMLKSRDLMYDLCVHTHEYCERLYDSKVYTCLKCGRER